MNSKDTTGWTVRAIGVFYQNGERIEKPYEEFSKAEQREIAERKNREALRAAGYIPVNKDISVAL